MSNHHEGKTRVEFIPEEIERLLILVKKELSEVPLGEVMDSPLPGLFNKLNRGYRKIKPTPAAVGSQR